MHKHRWKLVSLSKNEGTWKCSCGEHRNRKWTPHEQKQHVIPHIDEMFNPLPQKNVHRFWHPFAKWLNGLCERKSSYDVMQAIEGYAKRKPESGIMITDVDDDAFASSNLVIMPHQSDYEYMGASVIFVPQCTGEKPIKFFMYPSHVDGLMRVLKKLQKLAKKKRKKKSRSVWNLAWRSQK